MTKHEAINELQDKAPFLLHIAESEWQIDAALRETAFDCNHAPPPYHNDKIFDYLPLRISGENWLKLSIESRLVAVLVAYRAARNMRATESYYRWAEKLRPLIESVGLKFPEVEPDGIYRLTGESICQLTRHTLDNPDCKHENLAQKTEREKQE